MVVALLATVALAGAADSQKVLEQNQPPVVRQVDFGPAVWLAQAPNAVNGLFSDLGCELCPTGVQIIAENFVISTGGVGVNVNQIVIWGGYYPSNVPVPANFEILFQYDNAGVPGGVLYQASLLPSADVLTGVTLFGVSEHQVTFDFPPVTLPDGTYFVEIHTNTGVGNDAWFWETGNLDGTHGVAGSTWATEYPATAWNYDPATDLSITLNGELVPVELQSFDIE
ncbi:MAG: hypothetical protein C3F15_15665 [Holophagae bacterium]|nr:MAG: hypothetical protein C3F15_15665 [Holophagae bacterium]